MTETNKSAIGHNNRIQYRFCALDKISSSPEQWRGGIDVKHWVHFEEKRVENQCEVYLSKQTVSSSLKSKMFNEIANC